ncbi:hypothetical protein MKZ38_007428 [Zalerion maritima]|uniref:Alpha-ketoglutarate-dependent dioxygenase AlkB-like domain-containing protein n=1 Tax=Zalerion maritima TaxID=339359 RepID=A0AAD5WVY3_9PEZI|nr:hypothetical protein MKZ38_007428 [Zalerion maritima]
MTVDNLKELDAHEQPSDQMKALWKSYSKTEQADLLSHAEIDDLTTEAGKLEFLTNSSIPAADVKEAFSAFDPEASYEAVEDAPIYYHPLLPGLLIVPNLMPTSIQRVLLSKLIHRDLSKPPHQTNLHLHYELPYPSPPPETPEDSPPRDPGVQSFFVYPPTSPVRFLPHDPTIHKPLSIKQVLERRLHWVTLGGQYDWTNRIYPSSHPPSFPPDISSFLEKLFPQTLAQAAIVNFYTPGDTMMMHRDVSEEVNRGLVSLSMGCDALFMITPNDVGLGGDVNNNNNNNNNNDNEAQTVAESEAGGEETVGEGNTNEKKRKNKKFLLLRIRSGDGIYMTEEARYAWHGVPKVLKGTCPEELQDWPAEAESEGVDKFSEWKGWLKNKRINLNVRQMRGC